MTLVVHFIGPSGSGKTTLIEKLIRRLKAKGLRVGAVKHAHHGFTMDKPGKDSYRFRHAGAAAVSVVSPHATALLCRRPPRQAPARWLMRAYPHLDIILVEGFRHTKDWRFHVQMDGRGKPLKKGGKVLGVASRTDKPSDIARLIMEKFNP